MVNQHLDIPTSLPTTITTLATTSSTRDTTSPNIDLPDLQSAVSDLSLELMKLRNSSQRRVHHCHLYVSTNQSSISQVETKSTDESILGCPVEQAHLLRDGSRRSFKVKINKDHLLVALSSSEGNEHRVRIWKKCNSLPTFPTTSITTNQGASTVQQRNLRIMSWNCRGIKTVHHTLSPCPVSMILFSSRNTGSGLSRCTLYPPSGTCQGAKMSIEEAIRLRKFDRCQ